MWLADALQFNRLEKLGLGFRVRTVPLRYIQQDSSLHQTGTLPWQHQTTNLLGCLCLRRSLLDTNTHHMGSKSNKVAETSTKSSSGPYVTLCRSIVGVGVRIVIFAMFTVRKRQCLSLGSTPVHQQLPQNATVGLLGPQYFYVECCCRGDRPNLSPHELRSILLVGQKDMDPV